MLLLLLIVEIVGKYTVSKSENFFLGSPTTFVSFSPNDLMKARQVFAETLTFQKNGSVGAFCLTHRRGMVSCKMYTNSPVPDRHISRVRILIQILCLFYDSDLVPILDDVKFIILQHPHLSL